jgi:hypothetical protein
MDESGKFEKVFVWKRPRQSASFMKTWVKIHGGTFAPPVQPDFDMIIFWQNKIIGVEVKYFKHKGKRIEISFYREIDQALSLLSWGFDHVGLWHIYDEISNVQELWFYGIETWLYLLQDKEKGGLGLPLEFTPMKISKNTDEFNVIIPTIVNNQIKINESIPLYHPRFIFSVRNSNPIINYPRVKQRREILLNWLETQK